MTGAVHQAVFEKAGEPVAGGCLWGGKRIWRVVGVAEVLGRWGDGWWIERCNETDLSAARNHHRASRSWPDGVAEMLAV
jgi:hypothetical protein